jgi:hypothetical protein
MPGTRTAPTIDGAETYQRVSVTVYDYTGEQRTDSFIVDAGTTPAEIEAFVLALQAITNATIWRVQVADVYDSNGDPENAVEAVWENAKDNVVVLTKDVMNNAQDYYVPSPINDIFIEGTENLDPSVTEFNAWLATLSNLRTGFAVKSARFTHRRQIGSKINL